MSQNNFPFAHRGNLPKYPDISYIRYNEKFGQTLLLTKNVNGQSIGAAIRLTDTFMESDEFEEILAFQIEEAVKMIHKKEDQILGIPREWNPSSRKVPRCLK